MLTARGRPEDVLQASSRRRRLPAEAVRAGNPAGAHARAAAAQQGWAGRAGLADGAATARRRRGAARSRGHTLDSPRWNCTSTSRPPADADGGDLLRYLLRNAGKAVSRKAILEDVWDLHEDTDTRAIDNFIVRLRRYLEQDPTQPKLLLTVRSVGYRLQLPWQRNSELGTSRSREPEAGNSHDGPEGCLATAIRALRRPNQTNAVVCVARKLSSLTSDERAARRRAPAARRRCPRSCSSRRSAGGDRMVTSGRGRAAAACAPGAR